MPRFMTVILTADNGRIGVVLGAALAALAVAMAIVGRRQDSRGRTSGPDTPGRLEAPPRATAPGDDPRTVETRVRDTN
jgi:hypothetical protein